MTPQIDNGPSWLHCIKLLSKSPFVWKWFKWLRAPYHATIHSLNKNMFPYITHSTFNAFCFSCFYIKLYGLRCEKTRLCWMRTTIRSLISVFVTCYLKSIVIKLAPRKISIFVLVLVAKQAGLSFTKSEAPKIGISCRGPYFIFNLCLLEIDVRLKQFCF